MKKTSVWLTTIAISTSLSAVILEMPAQAVKLSDGKVYFVQPPRLLGASTTQNSTRVWGATYYFTLNVPENAGEPLRQIMIAQQPSPDRIRFDVKDTHAFEGTRRKGTPLTLSNAVEDRATQTVTLQFDPPVAPGKTITIALSPIVNPDVGGVYLFGVTAFPLGENPYGQFLGFGRLQFYDSGRDASFLFRRNRSWR